MTRKLAFALAAIGSIAASAPSNAQESALPVDRNSQEVRDAQKRCTADLKLKLFRDKMKKTVFGAEEEAFQRCKEITGWQSPR